MKKIEESSLAVINLYDEMRQYLDEAVKSGTEKMKFVYEGGTYYCSVNHNEYNIDFGINLKELFTMVLRHPRNSVANVLEEYCKQHIAESLMSM